MGPLAQRRLISDFITVQTLESMPDLNGSAWDIPRLSCMFHRIVNPLLIEKPLCKIQLLEVNPCHRFCLMRE